MLRICDIMHRGVIYCYLHDTVADAARMMLENQVRAIVVADENGEVWGMVSNMDIIALHGRDLDTITVEQIMKPYKIEVDPLWPVEKAVELMKRNRFEHLIIVDPNAGPRRPVAIVTSFDIIQYMSALLRGEYLQTLKMSSG
jgi:CBS domain-containing protein